MLIHQGGKHGASVVPGKSADSRLLQRILASSDDERMPPEGKPLTPEQIALLKNWIDQGARHPSAELVPSTPAEHWAFQPVRRPALPPVKNQNWPRNPIDHFVLARLEARGWQPAPAAAPRDLLRRIHLDLTGLPPTPPTHPELLDWLADWFVKDAKWSLKSLHKIITTSSAYRMSKAANADHAAADPENRLLWRVPLRRLEVEAIRDSILAVSGQLHPKMFGPAMKPAIPAAALEANTDKQSVWKMSDEPEASRRTIYAFIKRGLVVPMLEVLDLGDTVHSCPQRQITTVAPQALSLFNNEFIVAQARHFAARVTREAGPDATAQIDRIWRLALCRAPSRAEQTAMLEFRRAETQRLVAEATTAGKPLAPADADRAALEQICRAVFNLNEFVYPE